jgi:hypothetical protein
MLSRDVFFKLPRVVSACETTRSELSASGSAAEPPFCWHSSA